MKHTLAAKIIHAHRVRGSSGRGATTALRVDQTLTQDATGTMACLQFEALGVARARTKVSVNYVDHNTLQCGFENADDHRYLQSVSARYGMVFSKAGNGICHQVHLERFGKPGATLLGADSHTPTGGGLGQLAIGAGGLDIALCMAGEPYPLPYLNVCRVLLKGRLSPWVSAKDVALTILARLTTHGNVGWVLEYDGPGIRHLTVPERATITNMGAETGVTTSLFPSDEQTRRFLRAQGRVKDWRPLAADPGAAYDRTLTIDLGTIVPMLAKPHSPGNVAPVRELAGLPVEQVLVGSCTNASFRDLSMVAEIVKGRTVHPRVSFGVAPGSRQALHCLSRSGTLATLVASGARLLEAACGFCIGNGQAPGSGSVSLRTSNRNFEGRSGTRDAQVYLVSPETAAVSALAGELTDPARSRRPCPRPRPCRDFLIDDSLLVFPPRKRPATVFRGPNIGPPPRNTPLPGTLRGPVAIKVGDRVTTDHIMPAGVRLVYRSNIDKYADYVFEGVDGTFASRARQAREDGLHPFIVAGFSYGQGSSREHAAICPMVLGVKAVLACSFERIHSANLVHAGILPLVFLDPGEAVEMRQGDALEIPRARAQVAAGRSIKVLDRTRGKTYLFRLECLPEQRPVLLAGGTLAQRRQPPCRVPRRGSGSHER